MAPVEPLPNQWRLPDPVNAPDNQDLLGAGADIDPGTMLAAYRSGLFPMGLDKSLMGWWSPNPRGVLRPREFHTSRSLARSARGFEVTLDTDFAGVVEACADPTRPHGWITQEFTVSYAQLHTLGWAHSIEVWDQRTGRLAGGLFGIEIGGLFAAESKFHHATDASKLAVKGLASLLSEGDRLIDVQWSTPHLASLGVQEVSRAQYLAELARLTAMPPALSR